MIFRFGDHKKKPYDETKGKIGAIVLFCFFFILGISAIVLYLTKDHSSGRNNISSGFFSWTQCTNSNDTMITNQPDGFPYTVPYGKSTLPKSNANSFLILRKIMASDCSAIPVARSYEGYDWEGLFPTPLQPNCTDGVCTVRIRESPFNASYRVDAFMSSFKENIIQENLLWTDTTSQISRFLIQSSFGPTQETINSFQTNYGSSVDQNSVYDWIKFQMGLPATLTRKYYRQRSNPRMPQDGPGGTVRTACQINSRWHRFAFNQLDRAKILTISASTTPGMFGLFIDDVLRTEVRTNFSDISSGTYIICSIEEMVDGKITLAKSDSCDINIKNPPIDFITVDTSTTQVFRSQDIKVDDLDASNALLVKRFIASCVSPTKQGNTFIKIENRGIYKHDPRLRTIDNTLDNPANASSMIDSAETCPTVVKTFLNDRTCAKRQKTCGPLKFSSGTIPLNASNLRMWYKTATKHVHYITGLRLEDPYDESPCESPSRWRRVSNAPCAGGATELDALVQHTIAVELSNTNDHNPYVRDINVEDNSNCTGGKSIIGAKIEVDGVCWEHCHPDLYGVFDFSYWTLRHDGNKVALMNGRPNPIARWAELDKVDIVFPSHHEMSRWKSSTKFIPYVGRYGDDVNFESLHTGLQTYEMAKIANAIQTDSSSGFEACGSPGEVSNDPSLGNMYRFLTARDEFSSLDKKAEMDWPYYFNEGKSMLWTNVALKSSDQLRQRMAWALSQILVIGEAGLVGKEEENENWASYYDIFVRHAFGNYRDILKEVSYHPMMGEYLTYIQNKAFSYAGTFPDENYAREIMQLFSIGLWKLNMNGTYVRDSNNERIPTYNNDDIVTLARVWTGFDIQNFRGNLESKRGTGTSNYIDPMQIKAEWHDIFPKTKLDSGYLGDAYPLCNDLPSLHFLSPGARYQYTGKVSSEGVYFDTGANSMMGPRGRFEPSNTTSSLYKLLCQPVNGRCTYPEEVLINEILPCDGVECKIENLRVVKINNVYYDYIRQPCTRLTFFSNGKITTNPLGKRKNEIDFLQCANPETASAGVACCESDSGKIIGNYQNECLFAAEFVKYDTVISRCQKIGGIICPTLIDLGSYPSWKSTCAINQFTWTSTPCEVQVQVHSNGFVNIVSDDTGRIELALNSQNTFRVRWDNNLYPTVSEGCGEGCRVQEETCLCKITVETQPVFLDSTQIPSRSEIENSLFIGSPQPSTFEYGSYSLFSLTSTDNIRVFLKSSSPSSSSDIHTPSSSFDIHTIFELPPKKAGGKVLYLINKFSTVHVGNQNSVFKFRNPPSFMPLVGEAYRTQSTNGFAHSFRIHDVKNEIEDLIDHIFEHESTPSFIAYRLIQRFVTSNPSTRYVKAVATAFATGKSSNGRIFSGKYGDLGATITTILLDQEARSTILYADPHVGKLREPLLKVLHFLRAMEYTSMDGREVNLRDMDDKVGMHAFKSPTVFNFYLPEYQPAGPIGEASLFSPEAELATTPLIIGFFNGIFSLINYGLTSCSYGFGDNVARPARTCGSKLRYAASTADGQLSYTPSTEAISEGPLGVINELDVLLTAGRLNVKNKEVIADAYAAASASSTPIEALKLSLKLFMASSEFHTTNLNTLKQSKRPILPKQISQGRPYKAIIVLFLKGGVDSFNILVPHSNCGNHDLYNEYASLRTNVALPKSSLHKIQVPDGTQPCSTFGIHSNLPILQSLYEQDNAAFIANMGALVEPVTKEEYNTKTKRLPPSLFAHNIMQRSMHNVYAQVASSNGVLARIINAATETENTKEPYNSHMYSLAGNIKMLEGGPVPSIIDKKVGVTRLQDYDALKDLMSNITNQESESVFADTFSSLLESSLEQTELLGRLLDDVTLDTTFEGDGVSQQFEQVSKLMKLRSELGTERDVFVTSLGGFDTHNNLEETLIEKLDNINAGIAKFVDEMKAQSLWNDVVLVTVSDFGRTLTSNGRGTDHAWGGNYFVLGGNVRGKQILGHYPEKLGPDSANNIGRGRILPTTSWEAMWLALAQWFGVEESQMSTVLPNKDNFPLDQLITKEQLFTS